MPTLRSVVMFWYAKLFIAEFQNARDPHFALRLKEEKEKGIGVFLPQFAVLAFLLQYEYFNAFFYQY